MGPWPYCLVITIILVSRVDFIPYTKAQNNLHRKESKEGVVLSQIAQKVYGAPTQDLLQFYSLSTLEYGDVLWHGGLTNAQSANIERVQKRAFRIILPGVEYFVVEYFVI